VTLLANASTALAAANASAPAAANATLPLDAYIALPPGKAAPAAAVIIFTDIYGFGLNNTRLWADRLAKAGPFLVVVPDFFRGDSLTDATRSTVATCGRAREGAGRGAGGRGLEGGDAFGRSCGGPLTGVDWGRPAARGRRPRAPSPC
jgi:hypothetical protein